MRESMLRQSRLAFLLLIGAACACGARLAAAQDYPTKPIRLISPVAPGTSALDIVPRLVAGEMSVVIGQSIVVENKPGAGMVIGMEYVAKQVPADGYTIAAVLVPILATLPLVEKDLRFDPLKDLPPVIGLAEGRYILASSSKAPWKTFNDLVAYARANPGKLNWGDAGAQARLQTEGLLRDLGLNAIRIPYSAGGPLFQDMVAGEVPLIAFVSDSTVISLGEKLRVLAVTGQQRRAPHLDVPTFSELGHPNMRGIGFSLNVPLGIPKVAFDKLHAAASRTLQQPQVRAQLAKLQLEIVGGTPEAAAEDLANQSRFYADIAKKAGIQPK